MKFAKNYNKYLVDLVVNVIPKKSWGEVEILDFGAGDAFFAKEIRAILDKEIICVEPAENMQKFYSKHPYKNIKNIACNSVDIIYSFNVLEHIEKDEDIIEEFKRVLKKGGKVVLYLPAFMNLWSSMDVKVGHYRRYVKKDMKRLFDSDWNVKKIYYADFFGYFVTWLYKIIGNKSGGISKNSIVFYDNIIFPISKFIDKITFGRLLGKNIVIIAELIKK
jgi:SAM-dependent methyltransferase